MSRTCEHCWLLPELNKQALVQEVAKTHSRFNHLSRAETILLNIFFIKIKYRCIENSS